MGPCTLLPHFRFFINSVFFLSYHKFQTKAAPTFAQGSKNLFSHIKFIVKFLPNRWRSTVSFSVFQLFWAMLTLNNFSKNLKLRVRYFFGTLDYILRGKKRWRQPGRFEVERPIYIYFFVTVRIFLSPLVKCMGNWEFRESNSKISKGVRAIGSFPRIYFYESEREYLF